MIYFSMGAYAFREIREDDLPLLLEWRNSPFIHAKMLTNHKITWEEHLNWFRRISGAPTRLHFMFTCNGQPIGYKGYSDVDFEARTCSGGSYIGELDKCPKDAGIYLFFMSVEYAFTKLGMERFEIDVFASNKKALRLDSFMGYEFDKINGYCVTKDGKQKLVYHGVLTKEKWMTRRVDVAEMLQFDLYDGAPNVIASTMGGGRRRQHLKKIFLRRAVPEDLMILYRWVNEPSVRANSFHSEPVSFEEHHGWFFEKLNDPNEAIYILMLEDNPIGQVRLSGRQERLMVSYSIDVKHRRQGFGTIILQLIEERIFDEDITLIGRVKKNNVASQAVFRRLDYVECELDDCFEYRKVVNRRSKIILEADNMNEQEFLTKMKEDILDTEDKLTMGTALDELEDWDSLAIVDFIAMANSVCGKKVKRTDVTGAKTFADLYALLK